jgi:hypothetical protein
MLHLQTEHSKLHLEYKKLHLQTEQNSYIAEEFEDSNAEISLFYLDYKYTPNPK